MSNDDVRQLVRIRHELRRLLPARRGEEDRIAARQLLERMRNLAAPHATENARIEPELTRWSARFQIGT